MWVTAQQDEPLDALCYRAKRWERGIVEATLEVNPGLVEHGPFLPHGLAVWLPDIPSQSVRRLLQLWD